MSEKKPGGGFWNSLTKPFGAVPSEVNDFFGAEAPQAEPTKKWTAEEEEAFRKQKEAEQQAAEEAKAKATQSSETKASPTELLSNAADAPSTPTADQTQAGAPDVASDEDDSDPFAGFAAGLFGDDEAPANQAAKPNTKSHASPDPAQTDRPAIVTPAPEKSTPVPAKASNKSATNKAASQPAAKETTSTMAPSDDSSPASDEKTVGKTIRGHWDSLVDSLGMGGKARAERKRAQAKQRSEDPAPQDNDVKIEQSQVLETTRQEKGDDETEDRFTKGGFAEDLFGNSSEPEAKTDPLDDLFIRNTEDSDEDAEEERPRSSGKRRGRGQRPTRDLEAEDVDSLSTEVDDEEDHVEFEVVDLDGEDISDLWTDEPAPRRREVTDSRPRGRGSRRGRKDAKADPVESDSYREQPSEEDESPSPRSRGQRSRRSTRDERGVDERPPRNRAKRDRSEPNEQRDDSHAPPRDGDDAPRPRRRRSRTAEAEGEAAPAPRRRNVPTWRRTVNHIVDLNLGNRRGGGGRRDSRNDRNKDRSNNDRGDQSRSGGGRGGRRSEGPRTEERSRPESTSYSGRDRDYDDYDDNRNDGDGQNQNDRGRRGNRNSGGRNSGGRDGGGDVRGRDNGGRDNGSGRGRRRY